MNVDEDLNLDDFTDVVTLFKCKFCQYTDSSKRGIATHIKSTHLVDRAAVQTGKSEVAVTGIQVDVDQSTENSREHSSSINGEKVSSDLVIQTAAQDVQPDVNNDPASAVCVVNSDPDLIELNNSTSAVNTSWDTVEQAAVAALEGYLNATHSNTTDNGLISPDDKGSSVNSNVSDLERRRIQNTSESISSEHAVVTEELTFQNLEVSHPQHIVISDSLADPTNNQVTNTDSSLDGSAAATKELYLCGQCNDVFSSIDECKQHMIDDHELVLSDDVCLTPKVNATGKMMVDASIQTQTKKAGRKRKTAAVECAETEETQFLDSDNEFNDDKMANDEPPEGSVARKKRKIKTPHALKADYQFSRSMLRIARRTNTERFRKNREVLSKYTIACNIGKCSAKFFLDESLKMHRACHIEASNDFRCHVCDDETFKTWKTCQIHLYRKHNIDTDLFTCTECEYKCNTLSKLLTHIEIHGDARNYQCHVCGYQFKQLAGLRVHHSKEHSLNDVDVADIPVVSTDAKSPAAKQCSICQRTFVNRQCLSKHMQEVHKTNKLFSCELCDYTCSRKPMLRLHMRTHTGEKPHKCDQCTFASADHNSLRRHKMRHSGKRPYVCPHCPYSCIQSVSFKGHMLSKHPGREGLYACHLCSFQSVKKESLDNHLNDHSNGIVKQVSRKTTQKRQEEKQQSIIHFQQGQNPPSIPGLSDADAAQLIYSALNVIQEKAAQGDDTAQSFTLQIPCSGGGNSQEQTVYFAVHPTDGTDIATEDNNTRIINENNAAETASNKNNDSSATALQQSENIYVQNVESLSEVIAESGKNGTVLIKVEGTGNNRQQFHMIELQEGSSA
ncbi:uncharacterized protein LOC141914442 [Tubulanus polymorphus]|uniref:uncharacterized protein LOC141914442 n=1 Tax=Tubulanus polymorphus TaxID=672921 RepID=UPI003DA5DCA9